MRVLLISVFCILLAGIALFIARFSGLSTPYQRFDAAFLKGAKPAFFVVVSHPEEAKALLAKKSDIGFWIDVHQTSDGKLPVITEAEFTKGMTEKSFSKEQWKGPNGPRYTLSELRVAFPAAVLLEDFLKEFPQSKFILNIVDNVQDLDTNVVAAVEAAHAGDRVLIQSDAESVMKTIKEKQPLWLFGTSRGDLMRILSFESMWLEPTSPFFGDVFISPATMHNRNMINHGAIEEMHRRKKDVELGPLENAAEYDAARHENVEGFIFASPALAESVLAKP